MRLIGAEGLALKSFECKKRILFGVRAPCKLYLHPKERKYTFTLNRTTCDLYLEH
jgi:hypothetical protein